MININPDYNSVTIGHRPPNEATGLNKPADKAAFGRQIGSITQALASVDDLQKAADASVIDLLAGRTSDVTSVVSAVAKADMGFKLLVGVRNKLIEAYKQTMNMPL